MTRLPRDEIRTGTRPRAVIALVAVAALLKWIVVWQLADHPMVQPDVGLDTTAYATLAQRVVHGDLGLGPGLYYVSPLYIYVLAAGWALTDSFDVVRLLQTLAGALAVGGVWIMTRAARRVVCRRAGRGHGTHHLLRSAHPAGVH